MTWVRHPSRRKRRPERLLLSLTRNVATKQSCFPVIARSPCDEAIHLTQCAELDCFAALAMTHSSTSFHWRPNMFDVFDDSSASRSVRSARTSRTTIPTLLSVCGIGGLNLETPTEMLSINAKRRSRPIAMASPRASKRLIFQRAGEAHGGVHHGVVADRCIQLVVPVRCSGIERRVDVEGELLAEPAFFLEQAVVSEGLQSGDLDGREQGAAPS